MEEGPRGHKEVARDRWAAALLAVALITLYYVFRTHYHHCDAIKTATSIDAPEIGIFLHQNHLAFTPLVWLLVRGLRAFGWNGSVFAVAAAASSTFAGVAAGGLFIFLRRIGVTFRTALLAVAAAALSAGWWYNAGGAEQRSAIPFVLVGALLLLAAPPRRWYSAAAVAAWLGVGAWFHISITLFFPVAAILLAREKEGRWARLWLFGGIYAAVAFVPYVIVYRLFYQGLHGGTFYKWITFLHWWGGWGQFDWSRFWEGLLRLIAAAVAPGPRLNCLLTGVNVSDFLLRLGPGALFLAALIAVVAAGGKRLWREKKWWLVATVSWFFIYHLFFSWWAPQNAEWWVATLMPLWVLLALAAPRRLAFILPAAAVILCAAVLNFTRLILPTSRPGCDPAERSGLAIAAATRPGDVVLISRMRTRIWLENHTKRERVIWGSGGLSSVGEVKRFIKAVSRAKAGGKALCGDAYLTDYELDNLELGSGDAGDELRASLFSILYAAEPGPRIPFDKYPRVLYRCRGKPELESLRIYEMEAGTRSKEFRVLREAGHAKVFKIRVPEEGRYVLCLQARGTPAKDKWPVVRVLVDGRVCSTFPVKTDCWWFYDSTTRLSAGKHRVKVVLRNGGRDAATGEKRHLFVNRLAVYRDPEDGPGGVEPPG